MAKRTAVIDIGSNSVRIAIYEKTSRFAFHLIKQAKSSVKIGQGAYKQDGVLTNEAMQRTFETIKEYTALAKTYKCRKILSIATSALRDALNKNVFLNKISKQIGIKIRIINGDKEAYLGALAALNMLDIENGITMDIGGGSTELALIKDRIITKTTSINLGTVRLKELFSSQNCMSEAKNYIFNACKDLDSEFFSKPIIGIGGSIRSISSAFSKNQNYPIKVLHGLTYEVNDIIKFANSIINADDKTLYNLNIKSERFDTIGFGALIFTELLKFLNSTKVTVSGVGVREGVYLKDFLRTQKENRFPNTINSSIRSLIDRYIFDKHSSRLLKKTVLSLFDLLFNYLKLPLFYRKFLGISAQLSEIGIDLNYYNFERHSFYLILNSLYGYTHEETLLIATLVRYHSKNRPSKRFREKYKLLLPEIDEIKKLIFLLALSHAILKSKPKKIPFDISFEDGIIQLKSLTQNYIAIEKIKKINQLIPINITPYKQSSSNIFE